MHLDKLKLSFYLVLLTGISITYRLLVRLSSNKPKNVDQFRERLNLEKHDDDESHTFCPNMRDSSLAPVYSSASYCTVRRDAIISPKRKCKLQLVT